MTLPAILRDNLRLPVIASPLFIISHPALTLAQCKAGVVGAFPALEDEMCDFAADGLSSGRSPDRLDAFVWAVTALTERVGKGPRVRGL